jgi:hypothetical protein
MSEVYQCSACQCAYLGYDVYLRHPCIDAEGMKLGGIIMSNHPQPFITKDSGERQEFSTGMKRDVQTDKPRYDLIGSGWDLIKRWAELMGRGAIKYGELNFEKAATEEELRRFKASALRHMIQWFHGETDEDHASAVCFNLAGAEMVKKKLTKKDQQ